MLVMILSLLLILLLAIIAGVLILWHITPDVKILINNNPKDTSFMQIRQRKFGHAKNQKKQKWVDLSRISPYLIQAIIISENPSFLYHKGFDWLQLWESLLINIKRQKIVRGGSTITQQLAKNLYLSPSKSFLRKAREAFITYKLERDLSKSRILEIYINVIEWGENIYGAEAASLYYFKKSASELSLFEAIQLATCTPNPMMLTPDNRTNVYLKSSRRRVLLDLLMHSWISFSKYNKTLLTMQNFYKYANTAPEYVNFNNISPKLTKSEFWVSQIKEPDKLILGQEEINTFNQRTQILTGAIDIPSIPEFISHREARDKILEVSGLDHIYGPIIKFTDRSWRTQHLKDREFLRVISMYDINNEPISIDKYTDILQRLNLEEIKEDINIKLAITIKRTDILTWPDEEFIMEKPFDYNSNILQQCSLNPGQSVAVIHSSKDGKWLFVLSCYVDGWVRTTDLALAERSEVIEYPGKNFLVVTTPKCLTHSGLELHMGTKVRFRGRTLDRYEITIPIRDNNGKLNFMEDYVCSEFVSEGYLPYTKENTIRCAFKLLGTAYSWRGYRGGLDCSLFIQNIFSVFGISLPQNSKSQTSVCCKINKISIWKKFPKNSWESGITLLAFPDHIMLYLGISGGKHYVIHAISGVTDNIGRIIKIEKVAVTDLELGSDSLAGSLYERIMNIVTVQNEPSGLYYLVYDFFSALSRHPWLPGNK